ncbi:MAG: 3-oxoacyl-[acyl-carrier-protein] reductase [Rhodospirillaceae bacterium]|nr:MAG: 3-oxoacyl-[acyl-carrier-protein] reductase [Rhodospirillaceae bacterium]
MFDLTGKVALVTGASGGIGRATAIALAEQGATLILTGRREDALEETAAACGSAATCHIFTANLGDADSEAAMLAAAEEAAGQIDILVNNAGLTRDGLAMRMKDDDFGAVLDVNLMATFRLCRGAMKGMMKRRWGRLINVVSVVGFMGNAGQANYAASKAGIVGMTKSIAKELGSRGITANCVAPGYVETAMTADLPEKVVSEQISMVPAGRMGRPEEIAAAVAFLASEEAGYMSGATLHVNGGMAML